MGFHFPNLNRIITGDGLRKTRFHNYRGQRLDFSGFRYLPHCITTTLALKMFGRRPELPWLGYRAIKRLDQLIQSDWKVLEFGSGMSTLWLAKRCAFLISVETDESWYKRIGRLLDARHIENVDYRYSLFGREHLIDDRGFDLIIVDGLNRNTVMAVALGKARAGGYIYMDNSDVPRQDHRDARSLAIGASEHVEVFNDLYPTMVGVNEGMLVKLSIH